MERDDNLDLLLFPWLVCENWGNLRPWDRVGTLTSISSILPTSNSWTIGVDSLWIPGKKKKPQKTHVVNDGYCWSDYWYWHLAAVLFTTTQHNSTRLHLNVGGALEASLACVLMSAGIREQPPARRPDIPAGYGLPRLASTDIFLFFMATCAETSAPLCLTLVLAS